MHIFIRTTNKTLTLEVDSNLKIEKVKEQFEYQEGFRRDQYSLLFSGQKLEDDNTISSYNIPYGGIINFNREYILVFVEVFEEEMLFLEVNPSESIKKIRSDILFRAKYLQKETCDFPLYCSEELDDGKILSDYDIKEGMSLALKNPNRNNILIVIEELYEHPFALYVFPEGRVKNVRTKIHYKKNYLIEEFSLFFSNKELKYRSILSDFNVQYGDALRLERVKDSMIIFIRHTIFYSLTGSFDSVFSVNQNHIIQDIKSKIKTKFGLTHYQQDLWYNNHPLEDERTLESYNIIHRSKLVLTITTNENMISLVIHNFNEDIFIVEVKLNDTFENVKAAIQTKKGVPKDKQRLACNGEFLKDACTLSNYEIICWDDLHLYPMDESYFNIFIGKNEDNDSNFPLIVKSSYIIENIKEEINYMHCSPLSTLRLYKELQDRKTLLDYDINKGAILNLDVKL